MITRRRGFLGAAPIQSSLAPLTRLRPIYQAGKAPPDTTQQPEPPAPLPPPPEPIPPSGDLPIPPPDQIDQGPLPSEAAPTSAWGDSFATVVGAAAPTILAGVVLYYLTRTP